MSTGNPSYDVRIWGINKYKGKRRTTYTVRWRVNGERQQKTFSTLKLADAFRSELLSAARAGESFSERTGLPHSLATASQEVTWYQHACDFVDHKWPHASARHRKGIAEALTNVTLALLPEEAGRPTTQDLRRALYGWAFNSTARKTPPTDDDFLALQWIEENSPPLSQLRDARTLRSVLDALAVRIDGKPASPSTVARKRSAFYSSLKYAVELELLESNPLDKLSWKPPTNTDVVDRRVVVNPEQARELLRAVRRLNPALEGFFACLYFAGMRPAEARNLRLQECTLPEAGWGSLLLTASHQESGRAWTDSGESGEKRSLKHRAAKDTRHVPAHPELVEILRRHIDGFRLGSRGHLFVVRTGRRGIPLPPPYENPVSMGTVYRTWQRARREALTPEQVESMLARRPYDLRHACLSTWLNAGVPATQVAEWAGHSVNVLLRVYAKCIDGQDEAAKARIEAALAVR